MIINLALSGNDQIYCHTMTWWNHCMCEHKPEFLSCRLHQQHCMTKHLVGPAQSEISLVQTPASDSCIWKHQICCNWLWFWGFVRTEISLDTCHVVPIVRTKNIRIELNSQTRDCFVCLCINLKQNSSQRSELWTTLNTAIINRLNSNALHAL